MAKDPVPGKMLAFSDSLATRSDIHETQGKHDGASGKALALRIKKGLLALNASVMTGATVAILPREDMIKKEHRRSLDAVELLNHTRESPSHFSLKGKI